MSVDNGWDLDFDGEASFSRDLESINPDLSIGIIIWHPAIEVTRALPATYAEAEAQALEKMPPRSGNGDSVSKYFTNENSHEAFLNVRQTDGWSDVKDDPIFVEFSRKSVLIPLHEVISARNRPDVEPDEYGQEGEEQAMDLDNGDRVKQEPAQDDNWNVLDNLEQALSSDDYSTGDKQPEPTNVVSVTSAPSATAERKRKFVPVAPIVPPKDGAQEDILAMLGVTGSPKPVYATPGPAYMPPQQTKGLEDANGQSFDFQAPPVPVLHAGGYVPPPPPPNEQRSPSYDPWKVDEIPRPNGFDTAADSPKSQGSQHTLAGSDFHPDEMNGVNGDKSEDGKPPALLRSESSRKRTFDDGDELESDGKKRQHDDVTPRLRRKQPRVAAAYGQVYLIPKARFDTNRSQSSLVKFFCRTSRFVRGLGILIETVMRTLHHATLTSSERQEQDY
ncbi:hypothetical protein LTR16_004439 [Cryomyces antarcticus]|uniref:Uncharacterized protein n=1 Tax=Cryomyces antarcticus TaxID=329879 RepID=A0ABR0LN79_9PEZI|nr:hypothetical protein LTR16_004439 [Cryomyces antarcticus]